MLDGDPVRPPFEWVVSRVCEEFHVDPIRALDVWRRNRALVVAVMDLRAYARAYDRVDRARDDEQFAGDVYVDKVLANAGRKLRAAVARRKANT
jgi:hypothetical protein